jgi:hypothetical protein
MLRSLVVSPEKVSEDLTCLHLPSAYVPMLHSCLWTTLLSDLGALVLLNMRISSSRASPVSVSLPMRLFSCRSESPSSTERRLRIVTDVMPVTPFRYFREPGVFPALASKIVLGGRFVKTSNLTLRGSNLTVFQSDLRFFSLFSWNTLDLNSRLF